MSLIEETTCGRALELAAWLKGEIGTLRVRVDAQRAVLREAEDALHEARDILAQARQEELFKDE
jgi:hypothetical protein